MKKISFQWVAGQADRDSIFNKNVVVIAIFFQCKDDDECEKGECCLKKIQECIPKKEEGDLCSATSVSTSQYENLC